MIKKIHKIINYLFDTIILGFYSICFVFSKGFYFYFYLISNLLEKIFHLKIFKKLKIFFQKKQNDPVAFLMVVFVFLFSVFLYTYLYVDKNDIKYVNNSILEKDDTETIENVKDNNSKGEINLFRKYGKMDINSISFKQLKEVNSDVVAWIMVDGTNINYPIVQTSDNDYYINHDIRKSPKASGWTFMDYRNSNNLEDNNTIFYGHNLLNKTAFGSISNVFTKSWFDKSNHYIIVRTENEKRVYEIFSCYYIDPEVYYLQNIFYSDSSYLEFLNKIKERSIFDFSVDLDVSNKIITLSTCSDDNKGRKVVHAKLIS